MRRTARKYLVDSSLNPDQPLVMFLSHFSSRTSMISMPPIEFVQLLGKAWKERQGVARPAAAEPSAPGVNVEGAQGAVFISYASENRDAAQALAEALARNNIPVWYDRERLQTGDAWDARIKQAVQGCAYFLPLISRTTESIAEGYFRKEWKLAAERSHMFDDRTPFLVPVLIDDGVALERARVPSEFTAAQGTSVPAGRPDEAFVRRMIELMRDYMLRSRR
jgi:hypothetical protein